MGRDWAPIEHYLSEQWQIKRGYGDLFAFLEGLKFVSADGEKVIINPSEEMAIRRQFPQLGRLLMDDFIALHDRLSLISGGIDFLHKKDDELADLIGAMKISKDKTHYSVNVDDKNFDSDSYLVKWFTGRLDEYFYYSDRNNELFVECMLDEAMIFNREVYDAQRFEAALQYAAIDVNIDENREFFKGHANKLIYIAENKKDLLDFDFWVRYELLLGEKITWDEYVAVDKTLDGDPHDVSVFDKKTINTFKEKLAEVRLGEKVKPSLEENIQSAENMKSEDGLSPAAKCDNIER